MTLMMAAMMVFYRKRPETRVLLPSVMSSLLSMLETPLAPMLAWLILLEPPTLQAVAGGALILGAAIWSQGRPGSWRRRPDPI